MSEQLREALSAIVDAEASEFELRRVLDEMGKDEELVRAWQSYHLIRQAAQGENVQGVAAMGDRIWASLDADQFLQQDIVQEEPAASALVEPSRRPWRLAGGAVAAVLALGIFLVTSFDSEEKAQATASQVAQPAIEPSALQTPGAVPPARLQTAAQDSSPNSEEDFDYGPGFVSYGDLSAADQARSDGYFLHHVQHQALNNDNVLSFVKMISYPQ